MTNYLQKAKWRSISSLGSQNTSYMISNRLVQFKTKLAGFVVDNWNLWVIFCMSLKGAVVGYLTIY